MGDVLDVTDGSKFSISGWFYRDTATATHTIVAKKNASGTGAGYLVYLDATTDKLVLDVGDGTNTYSVASTSTFTAPGWYHFVAVWDDASAATTEIYINGTADNSTDTGTISSLGNLSNALNLRIGAESDAGNPFDGKLDEIRVYNRALSAGEIQSLYTVSGGGGATLNASQNSSNVSGLVGQWSFNGADVVFPLYISATGGTITTDGDYKVHTFTSSDTFTVTGTGTAEVLVVGGGGSGGGNIGGGGGAGGYIYEAIHAVTAQAYTVTVGAGGTAVTGAAQGNNGGNSVFDTLTAVGGGGGGYYAAPGTNGSSGGSGGGGGASDSGSPGGGTGTSGQGNNGGAGITQSGPWLGGGGGGAAGIGGAATTTVAGSGGAGTASSISGSSVTYAKGGGGGAHSGGSTATGTGAGGVTGGATGGSGSGTGGSGTANRGDGGGGGGFSGQTSGAGGSGVVILRYQFQGVITSPTAYDRSGSGFNGTLTNGPAATLGQAGQALDFNGTDQYADMGDVLDVTDGSALSISGWFYRDTATATHTIVAKKNASGTGAGYLVYLDATTDKLVLDVGDGTNTYSVASTSTFTAPGWYHFVAVWDDASAATTEIYINGTADNSTDTGTISSLGNLSNALNLRIGAESDAGNPFDGKLDEIRVYNRALSAGEIQSLYALGAPDKINSSVSTPQGTGRLDSGLSAYYAFDDNTGTSATDSSTRGNTGTLVNGPTWTTGQIGSAIDFDGTDDVVTAPDSPALDSTSDITVAVWAYADNWTGQGASAVSTLVKKDANYILRKDTDATTGGSGLKMFWWDGTNKDVLVVSIPSAGAWHHIVGINENNTTRRIYVDGILQSGTDDLNNTGTRSLTNVLSIGNHQSTGNESFDGRIDEVRIYNRALSSDEVTQLYRLTTPTGTDTGLKGYWSFNGQDLSGTTAYDRSGANNTGTLTNGPTAAIGKLGQALSFDGTDDYVNAGSSAILDDLATLTVSAWIKPTTSGEGNFGRIADKTAASTGWIFYMCADPGQANCVSSNKLAVYRDFSTTDGFWLSTTALTLGVWQHIAVTYDSSSASNDPIFYINGSAVGTTEVGTAPAGTAVSDAAQSLTIGNNPTAARTFNGSIDEVRLYSRILSATEIAALYNSGR